MDALIALSLASTLMRFADYGSKLLSQTTQSYKPAHGTLTEIIDVRVLLTDLQSLKQSLERLMSPKHASADHAPNLENGKALEVLFKRCTGAAHDFLTHLALLKGKNDGRKQETLVPKSQPSKWRALLGADGLEALDKRQQPGMMQFRTWDTFCIAFRGTWEAQEMEALEDCLWEMQRDIQFRILVSFRDALGHLASQRSMTTRELRKFTTRILESFYKSGDEFTSQMLLQSQKLLRLDESRKDEDDDDDDPLGITVSDMLHVVGSLQTSGRFASLKAPKITNPRLENQVRSLIIETCILDRLSFASMADRRESVEKAHARTFGWIYKDAEYSDVPWSNFVEWLRRGDGIYWINGKVGCGKSTLMRYLYENQTTQEELKRWAGDYPCEVYSFFFWNSGDEEQKSQPGLLKSLLFDILQRHRGLMPHVMPGVWQTWSARAEAALEENLPYDSAVLPAEPESLGVSALRGIFQNVLEALSKTTKLCFFIDGLDEYGAEHSDIVHLTKQCAILPNIKFCLSSRPLRIFQESFQGLPSLRLQDLTYGDLGHYVLDCLYSQRRMELFSAPEAPKVSHLIQEIVSKSQGVFLWVTLVVRSLVQSLPACESIADLQCQTQSLPGELEDLYAHLISKHDYKRASQIFQVFVAARAKSPEKITLLQLSWANDNDELLAEEAPMQKIELDEKSSRCRDMDIQLKKTCAGLLESHDARYSSMAPDGKVMFLHRTVSDWIAKPNVWKDIVSQTAGSGFSPSLALLKSCILCIKSLDISPSQPLNMGTVAEAVEYAKDAEMEQGIGFPKLFDQLDLSTAYQWRLGACSAVYGGDEISDTSSDTVEAQSAGSSSPLGTPSQLTSHLQSYRESMIENQEGIFGTLNYGTGKSFKRLSSINTVFEENELAASYIAHAEARFGGRTRDQPEEATPSRKRVATAWNHWAWGLEVPGVIPLHSATSFHDVARLAGLQHYLAAKENSANVLDQDVAQHMLIRLVALPSPEKGGGVDAEAVGKLLAGGADPNFAYEGQTPWEAALAAAASYFVSSGTLNDRTPSSFEESGKDWLRVMESFLRHDADPYAVAKVQDVQDRPIVSPCSVLESYVPESLDDEALNVMELLEQKRKEEDRKDKARGKRSRGLDIETATDMSSVDWPRSWIPIRNSLA